MNHLFSAIIRTILVISVLSSCMPQKKLVYLQKDQPESITIYELPDSKENRIKPNDELYISVSSFDDVSFNFFGNQSNIIGGQYTNELLISLKTYTVDTEGNISFPIIGKVFVNGLTLEELQIKITEQLRAYFDQPTVIVKYGFKKVTVLGEVARPGYYTYTKDQISIFDAVGMAGDLTVHGNRKEVILVRNTENKVSKIKINLTDDDLILSEFYYVFPDDIIYVKPRRSVKWNVISTPISLILSSMTTSVVIIDLVLGN